MEQNAPREFYCEFERHGEELHLVLKREAEAIAALSNPPGTWVRRKNVLIFPLQRGKKKFAVSLSG